MELVPAVDNTESLKLLLDKLVSHESRMHFRDTEEIRDEFKLWQSMLSNIYAVLDDTEEKQITSRAVRLWLSELRELAYDAEDVLDSFSTKQLRRKLKQEAGSPRKSKFQSLIPTCFSGLRKNLIRQVQVSLRKNAEIIMSKIPQKINADREDLGLRNIVNESRVYGREKDEQAILQLVKVEAEDVSVIPIIGMGGLGKTTLAQIVLSRAKDGFDFTAWVSVGEDFDVPRITKSILEQLDGSVCKGKDLNSLQEQLKEKLSRKKFLIVLDDVWNENDETWELCGAPLQYGSPGCKIVVTTRNQSVASIMSTDPPYRLEELAFDGCLTLFAERALGARTFAAHSDLEEVGNKIVKRCQGLPLAIMVIGDLLRDEHNLRRWKQVLNKKISEFPYVLSTLRLSYYDLPSPLKQCFAYCGIFPKDFEFEEDELILLWMAEGFLAQAKGTKNAKSLGHSYFRDLVSRSFFQQSKEDKSKFTMHGFIYELAEFESKSFCFKLGETNSCSSVRYSSFDNSCSSVRYSSFDRHEYDMLPRFEVFNSMKNLRSFLALPFSKDQSHLSTKVLFGLIPRLKYLRVLSLAGYNLRELPETIFALQHLRYLNFSYTDIVCLPELVGELVNLQTLKLQGCKRLVELPKSIGNLINLQWLENQETDSLQELPAEIAKLKNLITLPKYVVGKENGLGIADLGKLTLLQGKLHIKGLCNVLNARDAELANLRQKQGVKHLTLEWSSDFNCFRDATNELKVLNFLMPHLKLRKLWIRFYAGIQFPTWVGDPKFADMVHIELRNCKKIESLPPLGQLPMLMTLAISGLEGVKEVGPEFYGESNGNNLLTDPFPALETLTIEDMPEWVEWSCFDGVTGRSTVCFPKLLDLRVSNCPKLTGQLPNSLHCLQKLLIQGCQQLANLPETLSSLSELYISDCEKMLPINVCSLTSLTTVTLEKFASPTSMQEVVMGGLGGLPCVKVLDIENCVQLLLLGEGEEGLLPSSLESLVIANCAKLATLSNGLHKLTHLNSLQVKSCPKLVSFGEQGLPSSIYQMVISDCPSLKSLVKRDINTTSKKEISTQSRINAYHDLHRLHLNGCSSLTIVPTAMFVESLQILSICNLTEESLGELCQLVLPHLTELSIQDSPELEKFPDVASPTLRIIKRLEIQRCSNLRSLPNQLPKLTSLLHLEVSCCGNLQSFPEGGFPWNLSVLNIDRCKSLRQPISEWRLNRFGSLKRLAISGECPSTSEVSCFPDDQGIWLPTSLTDLCIAKFSELKSVSTSLRYLTSLEKLVIMHCPKLKSFPKEAKGLPPSLGKLKLHACPCLAKQYPKLDGEYCVEIDSTRCDSC